MTKSGSHICHMPISDNSGNVHHAHLVLHCSSSPASGVERKRWIHLLSTHRDENDASDNFWWVLKIPINMWSPVMQSSYMRAFQSVYMCIVAKGCQHITFQDISHKWPIKNSTCDDRNTKYVMRTKKMWCQMKLVMTDIYHTSWQVISMVTS